MKKVLLVGHCDFDNPHITALLEENFDVEVIRAEMMSEVLSLLEKDSYDLVVINRIGAFDQESGIELIKKIKEDGRFDAPLMLVTNYEDSMKEAISVGAVSGFGKNQFNDPGSIIEVLNKYLQN